MKIISYYLIIVCIITLMAEGETANTGSWLSSLVDSISSFGNEDSEDRDGGWLFSIKDKILDTLDAVDDVIDLGIQNVTSIGYMGLKSAEKMFTKTKNWDAVKGLASSISGYDLDLNFIKNHLATWDWSSYLATLGYEDDQIDAESQKIDDLDTKINSFASYEESQKAHSNLPPECFMTATQLIRYAGYPCSTYTTVTDDGYIVTMHRIPFSKNEKQKRSEKHHARMIRANKKRPVVFLQHGILADSSTWCSSGSDRSLAFVLADEGYDVWMGNSRGNLYSRSHVSLNPDTDELYWRFSWQHMSEYDLPAMIDAILKVTRNQKLYYIGHSQGTLTAFTRLAEDPEFNDKIHLMIGLGPVATLGNITSPIRALSSLNDIVHFGVTVLGGAEILPRTDLSTWLTKKLHKLTQEDQLAYHGGNLLLFLVGFNVYHYHRDRLPIMLAHTPSGTSLHNIIHMAQIINSGKTEKWRYWTPEENVKAYDSFTPPEYDVSKIKVPIALFVGADDMLADPTDAKELADKLNTLIHYETLKDWDHLDFMWGRKAPSLLYPKIIKLIQNTESKRHKLDDEL